MKKPEIRVSSLNWLLSCHGARTLVPIAIARGLVANEETEITRSGTMIHYRGAQRLIAAGAVGTVDTPPDADIWQPDPFEKFIEDFWVDTVLASTPPDWAMEVEASLEWETPDFRLTGHLDLFAINADATEAEIDDLKAGYIPVDAADCNWQLMGYLVLLLLVYPTLRKVRLRIVQPRNNPDDGFERVTEVTVEINDDSVINFLNGKIKEALADQMTLETGKQCRYCPAALICAAQEELRKEMKIQLTEGDIAAIAAASNDETLGRWARDSKILSAPMEKARALLKARLEKEKGKELVLEDGTRLFLKGGFGPRQITDVPAALDKAKRIVPEDELFGECVKFSIGSFEGLVAKHLNLPKTSKKGTSAESWVASNFGALIKREPSNSLVIV